MSEARTEFDNFENALSNMKENDKLDDYSEFGEESEEFVPPSSIQFNTVNAERYDYDKNVTPVAPQPIIEPISDSIPSVNSDMNNFDKNRPRTPLDEKDYEIFENGPLQSEINSWKKKYGDIWVVDDLPTEQTYVYRDLNRYEYKTIIAMENTDALMREEIICEQCVLFPYEYSYGEMSEDKAGIPTLLASHIMETSGFTKASMPRRL